MTENINNNSSTYAKGTIAPEAIIPPNIPPMPFTFVDGFTVNTEDEFQERLLNIAPKVSDEDARNATPFDLLNSSVYTSKEIRDSRLDACLNCDRLFKPTKTCKECGCFMALKTWLDHASCPKGKW